MDSTSKSQIYGKRCYIAAFFMEAGATVDVKNQDGETPLHWSSYEGYAAIVLLLLENGANMNSKAVDGCNRLMRLAVLGTTVRMVLFLLEKGKGCGRQHYEQ
jgi:ankyrin repeat protein